MKKVLQISNYLYPHIGGIEQTCRDIANALSETEEYEQRIICFNEDASDGDYVCKRNETVYDSVDGVDVIRCGCFTKVASQSMSMSYFHELKKVLVGFEPDVVLLHYPNPFVSACLLPLLPNTTKFILYWHLDITKQKMLGKLFHSQSIHLLKRADMIIATSPNYIDGSPYLSRFRDKCDVIPSCIRPERFNVTSEALERADEIRRHYEGKKICLTVGRHVPYKGISYLIQASRYLDDNFAIIIGGKGGLTETLKAEANGDDKVEFIGRVSDDDLVAYYIACDVYCFPSITKNEAFGLSLAEAMYFEKPAVTFTIPGSGVNFVSLNNLTGIECPNCDAAAYSDAIKKITADSILAEKLGKQARQRVEENFLFEKYKVSIQKQIEKLLS